MASKQTPVVLMAAALTCGTLVAGETARAQDKPDVRIATGRQGGTYYRMGAIIADTLVRTGKVKSSTAESSSGAIESSRLIQKGTVQIGGMDKMWVIRALKGEKPYKEKLDLVTVMPMMTSGIFFIVPKDSSIKSLPDLKGKRVSVGARNSGMENHAHTILDGLGMTFKDIKPVYLSFGPGGRAVKDGKADTQLQCCLPNGAMTELSELRAVRVVPMDKDLPKIMAKYATYGKTVLKKGTFKGHDKDEPVLGIVQGWMGSSTLSEETAYVFASTLLKHFDEMTKKMPQFASGKDMIMEAKAKNSTAPVEVGAKMHPGSIRALKEAGILK
ncbi:MAG: TAXI family TRAP transporter solute-binding subunit [Beijerinckiaceae bacterium]